MGKTTSMQSVACEPCFYSLTEDFLKCSRSNKFKDCHHHCFACLIEKTVE